ncbi:molybdopterin-dependent oxidoreductase [Aquihabitans sp. G128]|uniref:molybdopterin-containing oxidoreductase family protein n=1 Tax=Aquihabitans sp. G128 TaxID=2849779 RepID=UPI001C245B93|nr:molybdopterin-dependent oxidoreductase [Aquihabitans sp. G128]QXC62754.1 molybdopterin-dependent oxidoreductase [Aquihabitans sp. G128]
MVEEHRSYCRICAAACGIVVSVDGEQVVGVRGDPTHPGSHGYTCPKGRALGAFHHSPARLDRPTVRGEQASWDDALVDLAAGLTAVREVHGPDGIGFYLATGLAYDSAGQIASMTWFAGQGSRQLYTAVTVDNAPVLVAAELVTGSPMLNPVWDPSRPGLLLLFGTNPVVSHGYGTAQADPVVQLRRYRAGGGQIWVLDPRHSETAAHADRVLTVRPGSDVAVLAWLCAEVLRAGADAEELAQRCTPEDVAALRSAVAGFDLGRAATASGVATEDLEALAAAVRAHPGRLAVMCGTGLTMGRDGVVAEWLRWALLILTGSLDRPGGMRFNRGGISRPTRPPRPARPLPGPPSRPELRTVIGQYPCVALVDEIEAGGLHALVVGGGNPLTAFPEPERTRAALASLDVLAVVDVAANELTELATHVLPVTGQLERADLTLAEGVALRSAVQHTPAIVAAGGARRPVWWVFAQLARRLGGDLLAGADPDVLTDDVYLGGVLGASSLDAAEVLAAGPHGVEVPQEYGWVAETLLPGGRWRLAPPELVARLLAHRPPEPQIDGHLLLTNRRTARRLNSLDHAATALGRPEEPIARLHPGDADRLGVAVGDRVLVTSAHGQVVVTARFDPGTSAGTISVNHGHAAASVANLTSTRVDVDPLTGMPLASGLPVTVERVGAPVPDPTPG